MVVVENWRGNASVSSGVSWKALGPELTQQIVVILLLGHHFCVKIGRLRHGRVCVATLQCSVRND